MSVGEATFAGIGGSRLWNGFDDEGAIGAGSGQLAQRTAVSGTRSGLSGRRNWLARRPRWHVHLTPTSSSWLNQVERFFALLTERQIRRGVHRSIDALHAAIDDFIVRNNR